MTISEAKLTDKIITELIALSEDWERENSCHGYRKNTPEDIEGNRAFLATEGGTVIGYLFGHMKITDEASSIYEAGTPYFEVEEIYVKQGHRSQGVGKKLFQYAESEVASEADMIMLSTATKNFRAILHFYIDELGMEFWSARLFKRIGGQNGKTQ